MEEDLACIPCLDGVVHEPHDYTPADQDDEFWCPGVDHRREPGAIEYRTGERLRVAMWVDYSGIKALHKMSVPENLEEAKLWIEEFREDVPDAKAFVIREVTEVRSYRVEL